LIAFILIKCRITAVVLEPYQHRRAAKKDVPDAVAGEQCALLLAEPEEGMVSAINIIPPIRPQPFHEFRSIHALPYAVPAYHQLLLLGCNKSRLI